MMIHRHRSFPQACVKAPASDDFYEFAAMRRMLYSDDLPTNLRALQNHSVHRWLKAQNGFLAAERSLFKKASFQAQCLPVRGYADTDWEALYFATLLAQPLGYYFDLISFPAKERGVISAPDLRKAHKAAAVLRLFIERGLTLPNGDSLNLYSMLEDLPKSAGELRMTSQRSGHHVPVMSLVRMLALMLYGHYGEMMPIVIFHSVSIVEPIGDPEGTKRTIDRHLKYLRPKLPRH